MQRAPKLCSFVILCWPSLGARAGAAPFDQVAFDKAVTAGGLVIV